MTEPFDGKIWDVKMHDHALTEEEIAADYESDSSDGRQPDMIAVTRAEWERVQAQLKQARKALEAVEWDSFGNCHWCRNYIESGHTPECLRQAALAAMDVKP